MKVTITIGPKMDAYLNDLLETGMYGLTRAEVARNMLWRSTEELIRKGIIDIRPPAKPKKR